MVKHAGQKVDTIAYGAGGGVPEGEYGNRLVIGIGNLKVMLAKIKIEDINSTSINILTQK